MEVKAGYKQTEVGVIPEEWGIALLGDCCGLITKGTTPTSLGKNFVRSGVRFLKAESISESGHSIPDKVAFIDKETHALLKRSQLASGDLLVSIAGVLGRIGLVDDTDLPGNTNQALAIVRLGNHSSLTRMFLFYSLRSPVVEKQIRDINVQAAQANISLQNVRNFRLSIPPFPEQRAIATALIDVDGLLGGLDRLIAKKCDLKQAAMQQLLTGQTRLPGFHGEWEVKQLGDVGSTYGGLTGKTKADFGEGPARYITFMNVMSNVVINCGAFEQVQVSPTESQNRARKGDLFFNGSSETPEEVAMCSVLLDEVQSVYLNSFCFGFRFYDGAETDGLFLAYYLRSKEGRELMKSLAQGSTRYNLSKVALLKSPLRLPKLPEQTAIAEVLSEMDAELAGLEQRREKTRALKQAMMQELLTGRTRLVAESDSLSHTVENRQP